MSAASRIAYAAARPLWHQIRRHPRLARTIHAPLRAAWMRVMPEDPNAAMTAHSAEGSPWPFVVRERPARTGAVLVVDNQIPEFDRNAGDQYMRQYMGILQELGYRLTYLAHDHAEREPYANLLRQAGIETLTGEIHVEEWFAANGPFLDAVVLARPNVAQRYLPLVRRFSRARVIYFTHDLHFLRERRRYEQTGEDGALRESEKLLLEERKLFRAVDVVATPSRDEIDEIRRLGAARALVWPPYFEIDPDPPPMVSRDAVLFVGGFSHPPNLDAATLLAREVMPLVWHEVPTASLLLVGNAPPAAIRGLASDRITVTGYVPDLAPYYARARVSVNPLRFGAGLKGKIVSSLAAGVPVVATSIANEGIGLVDGYDALLGETPDEIAGHVVSLLRDAELSERIARRGQELVARTFSRSETTAAIRASLACGADRSDG